MAKSRDILTVKSEDVQESVDAPRYTVSFRNLEEKDNEATNDMLQALRKINTGDIKSLKQKKIVKGTKNQSYQEMYDYLSNKGVEIDNIHEIMCRGQHRIFFFQAQGKYTKIISIIRMRTKHLKYRKR